MTRITEAFSGVWTSLVRTYVPWLVGLIVGWLASLGIDLDPQLETSLILLVTTIAGALYHVVIRLAERAKPKFGWLLGSAKQPVYVKPAALPVVEETAAVANAAVPAQHTRPRDGLGSHNL